MPVQQSRTKTSHKVLQYHPHPDHVLNYSELGSAELSIRLTPFDLKRLESYANNMLDYHVVLDLLPIIASLFFEKRLGDDVRLSAVQSSILLALGLQRKSIEEVEVSGIFHSKFPVLNDGVVTRPNSNFLWRKFWRSLLRSSGRFASG